MNFAQCRTISAYVGSMLARNSCRRPILKPRSRWCASAQNESFTETGALPFFDRLGAWFEGCDVSDDAKDGWIYGYALDGSGGGRKLEAWDDEVATNLLAKSSGIDADDSFVGYWVHLDFNTTKNVAWLWNVVQASGAAGQPGEDEDMGDMGSLWLSRLAEDEHVSLPRCESSMEADALFLSFRAALASHAQSECAFTSMVELRACLTRHLLLTARVAQLPEEVQLLPELERNLSEGRGGRTCGEIVAAILHGATVKSTIASEETSAHVFTLRKSLASLSQDLSFLRYDSTRRLRYFALQQDAFNTLLTFCRKRKQQIFNRVDRQRLRQAAERHEALIETLHGANDTAGALHGEIMTHVSWGTAEATYRLTYFGCIASVMIVVNVCASLLEFSERRGLVSKGSWKTE